MAAPKWSERPRTHRFAIVGGFIGMGIAAVVAFNYAYEFRHHRPLGHHDDRPVGRRRSRGRRRGADG